MRGVEGSLDARMTEKMQQDGIESKSIECIDNPTFEALNALSIQHSDGLIVGSENLSPETAKAIENAGVPTMSYHGEEGYVGDITQFLRPRF